MTSRIITAVIGIGIFLACCFWGAVPFAFATTALCILAAHEFIVGQTAAPMPEAPGAWRPLAKFMVPLNAPVTAIGVLLPMLASLFLVTHRKLLLAVDGLLVVAVAVGLCMVAHAWTRGAALGWFRCFYGKVGFWYIGGMFSSFVLLRSAPGKVTVGATGMQDRGAWIMLFVAVCVWATDTFAFFVGRAIGKRKLAPKLSPGKTVEGFIGGLIGAAVAGLFFGRWIGLPTTVSTVVGVVAGAIGPLGDLFESGLKRELGLKDFGKILPGHGGALDRFDSLLFVAPVAWMVLRLFGAV